MIETPIAVHPSQARRAMHNLSAQGVPIRGGGMYNGAYVIVVVLPEDAPAPDWRAAPAQRSGSGWSGWSMPAFNVRVFVQLLCVLAILLGVGYLSYGVLSGADLSWSAPDLGGLSQQARNAWDDVAAPWEPLPNGEPVVEKTGWRWPWESATVSAPKDDAATEWTWPPKNPVGDAIDTAGTVITWLVWALVIVGVLWAASLVAGIVRRVRG